MVNHFSKLFLFLAVLVLCACDMEVSSTTLKVEKQTVERSCSYNSFGYCFTCMPGFGGKNCSFKWNYFCTTRGTEYVEEQVTTRQALYESGESHILVDTQTLKVIQPCR